MTKAKAGKARVFVDLSKPLLSRAIINFARKRS